MNAAEPGRRSDVLALLVAGAFFMEFLDGTVIATALPAMARSFGTDPVAVSIGMTSYLLTLAVFIPISGWTADRFGARSVFAAAIGVFTVASVLCGLCTELWQFTAARVLQGLGGAMMVPVGRMVVLRTTEKRDLVRAVSFLTWPALVAPILGPPIGGLLTTYTSWRWIFLLNVPLGVLGLVLALRLVPDLRDRERRPFDVLGFLLSGAALGCLTYAMDQLGQPGAGLADAGVLLLVGTVSAVLGIRHMRGHPAPAIDLRPLAVPTFAAAALGGSLFRIAISSAPFLLPLMFQVGFGMSAVQSGAMMLAVFAGNLGMKTVTTPILRRFGFRTVLVANGLAAAGSLAACGLLWPGTPVLVTAAVLLVGGLSRSMQFTAIGTLFYADIPKARMSSAASLGSVVQQLAGGLGIAIGALALRGASALQGSDGPPGIGAFHVAFGAMAVLALLGLPSVLRLHAAAGAEVSGHRQAQAAPR